MINIDKDVLTETHEGTDGFALQDLLSRYLIIEPWKMWS
jgi:hypothetical protein